MLDINNLQFKFFKVLTVKNHNLFIMIVFNHAWNLYAKFLTLKNAYFHGKLKKFSNVQVQGGFVLP